MSEDVGYKKALHQAARELSYRDGFHVFPLVPGQKQPAVDGGLLAGTRSLSQIGKWWSARPWNIGVVTGLKSNLVVVDLDGSSAVNWWKGQQLPTTRYVKTGKGYHLYYRYPTDWNIRNSASRLAPNVDIRAEGGYVVAPPSLHPNGHKYVWQDRQQQITRLPQAVVDALHKDPPAATPSDFTPRIGGGTSLYGRAALRGSCADIQNAPKGARNDTVNKISYIVGMYVAGGEIDCGEAEGALVEAALSAGLSQREALTTVRRAITDAANAPKKAPKKAPSMV